MAAPTIVNSNPTQNGSSAPADHARKGSVTVAPGAYGGKPNGGHAPSASRPNINFGSMNADGASPAMANATPQPQSSSTLPAPSENPRVRSPAASPSPIPQPATSGGLPPPTQGNGLNFGSMGGAPSDPTSQAQAMMPGQQNAHFRRASSHSQHGDASNGAMTPGRGAYMGQGGRGGRAYSGQGFQPGQVPQFGSPAMQHRSMAGQHQPRGSAIPHQFQHQMGAHPGSPHAAPRSPGLPGSQPGTPGAQHMQMSNSQMGYQQQQHQQQPPHYSQYQQHLSQPQFGYQHQYDPNYPYYGAPQQMHPQHMYQGAPPSPRPYSQAPNRPYMQGPYFQPSGQPMSRTSSQLSERPASSMSSGQPPHPSNTPGHVSHTPSQSTTSIAPPPAQPAFTIPSKAKKGIIIKNAEGEVISFDNKKSSPASATGKAPSPAPSSSAAPTPPPRSDSSASHVRSESKSESKSGKTAEQIKAEFQEQVKRGQTSEKGIKEEPKDTASLRPEDAIAVTTSSELEQVKATTEQKPAEGKEDVQENKAAQELKIEPEAAREATPAPAPEATPAPVEESKATSSGETDAERKKREDDEEMERMIAEMEAQAAEEEAREKAFADKKAKEKAEKVAKEKAAKENADDEMKRLEREAEAAEEAREKEREEPKEKTEEEKAEDAKLFASLKKAPIGPGADSEASTPTAEESMPPPSSRSGSTAKPKPLPLKLETAKNVEPAQPTPGMRSLRSARMLQLQSEDVKYPEGIQSPNPALIQAGKRNGRLYDTSFLLQFKDAFKEKPAIDWDDKLKTIVGDNDSAGPKSARTPGGMGGRSSSHRGPIPSAFTGGPMGQFINNRTLPAGTTSDQRFQASSGSGMSKPGMRPGSLPMGGSMGSSRQASMQAMSRGASQRGGKNDSRRGERVQSRKETENQNKTMPLTAGLDLKPLEPTGSGWKPTSIGRGMATQADPSGHLTPDLVQRKVKSNLNKMTPERFDKIADQILAIAGQSKDETDGRTLRQVIALTFEKACDEAHWASMYAKFCQRMLQDMSPDIKDDNVRDKTGAAVVGGPLFRKYLLNRCQEEFERGWEVNLPEKPEGENEEVTMLSDEYYIAAAAKRKGLGLVQFIGELYKLNMLSIRIMHECVTKLLDFEGAPDEAAVESLVKLIRAVGATMEGADQQGQALVKTYFDRIEKIMQTPNLNSRIYFMLLDTTDLRKKGWKTKEGEKGPKTIQEIREEAAAAQQQAEMERSRTHQRGGGRMGAGRGDARNFSGPNVPPPNYDRNTVGTDELRKLNQKNANRQSSGPARGLGPSSMFGSRSNSGRPGLGPMAARAEELGMGSRAGSQRAQEKKEEDKTSANAFSALANIDGENSNEGPASPPVAKATPAAEQPKAEAESKAEGS